MHCWARPGEQYNCESIQVTISGTTSRYQWACHQFLLNALACSVFWSPPDVVHIVGAALLAFIEKTAILDAAGRLNPTWTCPYRSEYRAPEIPSWGHQPVSMWWFDLRVDVAVWAWEHMMHQQATYHWNAPIYHTSFAICAILSERSEGGQPLGQRITSQWKSNNLTLRKDKTCSWRGQFELGNTWCTNMLSITDACTGWNTA